jgi:hypothetical protein
VRRSPHWASGGVAFVALGAACASPSDLARFEPNPDPLRIVQTIPVAGETGVDPRVRIDRCWSARVDPRSVGDLDGTISSGNSVIDTSLQVQLLPWRGPGGATLPAATEAPWCSGSVLSVTPETGLRDGVLHRFILQPTAVGWDGEAIDTTTRGWLLDPDGAWSYVLEFWVEAPAGADPDPPEQQDDPPPTLTALFTAGNVFDPARDTCGCHRGGDDDASARLDLSTPEAAFTDLVVPSRPRDTGFRMVTPRRPSESFLLHKLLRDRDGRPLRGVLGAPMPEDGDALPYLDLVQIARWIEAGAEL